MKNIFSFLLVLKDYLNDIEEKRIFMLKKNTYSFCSHLNFHFINFKLNYLTLFFNLKIIFYYIYFLKAFYFIFFIIILFLIIYFLKKKILNIILINTKLFFFLLIYYNHDFYNLIHHLKTFICFILGI